jgi:hypothetical protein
MRNIGTGRHIEPNFKTEAIVGQLDLGIIEDDELWVIQYTEMGSIIVSVGIITEWELVDVRAPCIILPDYLREVNISDTDNMLSNL